MTQLSGRSDFHLITDLSSDEVLRLAREVLRSYRVNIPEILEAKVVPTHDADVRMELILSGEHYEILEGLMDTIASSFSDALRGKETKMERGATELVPV